jgi:uncharacterized membrane-anchored protein
VRFSRRLALLFALQAAALVLMVADRQWTLAHGTRVVLETEPVDPRSLFSGDYVRLQYKVSRLPLPGPGTASGFDRHDDVYVVLKKGEPYWEPVSVHAERPAAIADHVILRGTIDHVSRGPQDRSKRPPVEGWYAHIRYGIEAYFVPENEGRAIERPAPGETIAIRAAVDARGRAAIHGLLINGREKYVERLF